MPELPLFTKADPELLHQEADVQLPKMQLGEHIVYDYATLRLSLKAHPLALLRKRLAMHGIMPNAKLAEMKDGARITVSGLVLVRQRPGTAKEVIFVTLEDETTIANVIIWPSVFEKFRRTLLGARLLAVHGKLQRQGLVMHVIAERLEDLSDGCVSKVVEIGFGASPSGLSFAAVRPRGQGFRRRLADRGFPIHRLCASGFGRKRGAPRGASALFRDTAARSVF